MRNLWLHSQKANSGKALERPHKNFLKINWQVEVFLIVRRIYLVRELKIFQNH